MRIEDVSAVEKRIRFPSCSSRFCPKNIVATDANIRIAEGDPSVVNQLALVPLGKKQRNFYSFASKYCNHHNPEAFPIYDFYVQKMLLYFQKRDGFLQFRKEELRQYDQFVQIMRAFRRHYALEEFSLRQIDIYLWLAGKDEFKDN